MNKTLLQKFGFTLVELMIVIVIIGVLASLASFGYTRYVKSAKLAEAPEILRMLAKGSKAYFISEQRYGGDEEFWHPTSGHYAGSPVPFSNYCFPGGDGWVFHTVTSPPQGGEKVSPTNLKTAWTGPATRDSTALKKLNFKTADPMYFQYNYQTTSSGENAKAEISAVANFNPGSVANHTLSQTLSIKNGSVFNAPFVETNKLE